nr:MAG TPA: hypothetical protein [Caudoviricetes sp.]
MPSPKHKKREKLTPFLPKSGLNSSVLGPRLNPMYGNKSTKKYR